MAICNGWEVIDMLTVFKEIAIVVMGNIISAYILKWLSRNRR